MLCVYWIFFFFLIKCTCKFFLDRLKNTCKSRVTQDKCVSWSRGGLTSTATVPVTGSGGATTTAAAATPALRVDERTRVFVCVCVCVCVRACLRRCIMCIINVLERAACAFVCVSVFRAKSVLGDGVTTLDAIPPRYSGRRYGGATERTTNEALRTLRRRRRGRGRLHRGVPIDSYTYVLWYIRAMRRHLGRRHHRRHRHQRRRRRRRPRWRRQRRTARSPDTQHAQARAPSASASDAAIP